MLSDVNVDSIEKIEYHLRGLMKNKKSEIDDINLSLNEKETELKILNKVSDFFQISISKRITNTRNFMINVINKGLCYVYNDKITVDIHTSVKAGRVVYSVSITNGTSGISGGRESHGGGVVAVASFLFRFVVSYLKKMEPILILDESLSFVSYHYQKKLGDFISLLCKEFNYNVMLVSHQDELSMSADVMYELESNGEFTSISNNPVIPKEIKKDK